MAYANSPKQQAHREKQKREAAARRAAKEATATAVLEKPVSTNALDMLEESAPIPTPTAIPDPMTGAPIAVAAPPTAAQIEAMPVVEYVAGSVEPLNLDELVELQRITLPGGGHEYMVKGTNSRRVALYHIPSGEVGLHDPGETTEAALRLLHPTKNTHIWSRVPTPEWQANRKPTVTCPWCGMREPIQHKVDTARLSEFGFTAPDAQHVRKMTLLVHMNAFHKPELADLRSRGEVTDAELSMLKHF